MYASRLAAMLLLASPLVVACGEDEEGPEPVEAKTLPANLCAGVPADVVERWALVEDTHDTTESEERNEATCSMSGTAQGAPVTLEVSLSSFAAEDDDAVRELMEEALAERCAELESSGTGTVTEVDGRCTSESPAEPAGERGTVTEFSLAKGSHGISSVTMVHHGPRFGAVGAEVVAIGGTISQADPADLG